MDGLTAKVFRTYNASRTLQEQLNLLTEGKKKVLLNVVVKTKTNAVHDLMSWCLWLTADDNVPSKLLSYNRANRAVAVLCNHQRAAPKNFSKQMENLQNKVWPKTAD